MIHKRCYNCGHEWRDRLRGPGRSEYCEKCDTAWRCCRNCKFYDPNANNHCISHTTEKIADVEKPNFCDEYTLSDNYAAKDISKSNDQAAKEFDDLFKL